jgi:ATP-binding cassette subfamily G (WHITE) protein 2 (SNQ2)
MIVDVPLFAFQTLLFSSIYYFLLGLNPGAKYFFTFWFVVFTMYMAIANMYRMIGECST